MSSSPTEDIRLSRNRSGFLYYDVGIVDIHFSEIVSIKITLSRTGCFQVLLKITFEIFRYLLGSLYPEVYFQ